MSFDPPDIAKSLRERDAEMDRILRGDRWPDPRKSAIEFQRQFEEMHDPMRWLREKDRQIAQKFGLPPPEILNPAVQPIPQPLRLIEGGLGAKPRTARRGRPIGYVSPATKAAMLAINFYFEMVADPPRSVREIAREAADLASDHGLQGSDLLDPESHALREAAEVRLTARKLARAARGKAAE